jgi:GntR family transcriptional regulator / MocR family aminotransferase
MPDIPIILDPGATGPVYRQIVTRLRDAILSGTLPAGVRLPSSRSLASQLGVARGTVEAAYAVLAGEGVLLSRGSAGTVVSPHMAARGARAHIVRRQSRRQQWTAKRRSTSCHSAWVCPPSMRFPASSGRRWQPEKSVA